MTDDRLHAPRRGRLKVFLGAAAGVGKTYAMLGEARDLKAAGVDVVVGYLEPHGRRATEQRAAGLEVAPRRVARVGGRTFTEMDTDWLLQRAPQLCQADEVVLADLPPEALRERIAQGRVYAPEKIRAALTNFFRTDNLTALRALALREVAEQEEGSLVGAEPAGEEPPALGERVMVCVDGRPNSDGLVRRAARMARRSGGRLYVLHVEPQDEREPAEAHERVDGAEGLGWRLGATVLRRSGDVAEEIVQAARELGVTQIVLGESHRPRWKELVGQSIIARILRETDGVDVHIIADERARRPKEAGVEWPEET